MKKFSLKVHPSNFSEETLLLSAKDFPDIRKDDVVKISSADDDTENHLVIKVKSLKKDGELKNTAVSIEQGTASRFNLHAFQSVYVTKVDPEDISLDMVEVLFKDQYVSRSDMWRLKRHLVGSCTCVEEKIEFCDMRAQVNELWINGNMVKCGLVTDSTRIVLRSASALVYIFVQMSKEMWEFDKYGQLQFEKAVNGFLKELFMKWKDKCYHEFTLVLFSRSFFRTSNIEDFPKDIRYVVQKDYRGIYYIDFYYCIAHHERSDDCTPYLCRLKKLFNEYKTIVQIPGCPSSYNSSASEGNFLEAINMSLNVFDKHYIDRNFDRTGQIVICITPGVGVFDVDRDLTVLTKERMIDNGIGSDLVCLGQHPLHAVPLFKFHDKNSRATASKPPVHSFNIPHWIEHSFYSLNPFQDEGTVGIKHIPRAELQLQKIGYFPGKTIQSPTKNTKPLQPDLPTLLGRNFEEFDDEVFTLPEYPRSKRNYSSVHDSPRHSAFGKKSQRIRTISDGPGHTTMDDHHFATSPLGVPNALRRRMDGELTASSLGPASNLEKYFTIKENEPTDLIVGSAHSFNAKLNETKKRAQRTQRSLINPFVAPSTLGPITSNRRRWVHTYPVSRDSESSCFDSIDGNYRYRSSESSDVCEDDILSIKDAITDQSETIPTSHSVIGSVNSSEVSNESLGRRSRFGKVLLKLHSLGDTEFPYSPGVSWKMKKFPACLPITNDYLPSQQRLIREYVEASYKLIPDNDDFHDQLSNVVTTKEIFLELVNQRLCQGFQLVVPNVLNKRAHYDSLSIYSGRKSPGLRKDTSFTSTESTSPAYSKMSDHDESYTLNHGRQYHTITLNEDNDIIVKFYKPRHSFSACDIDYKYMLWAVGRDRFRLTKVRFAHEQYESYHWNYQDNCVCSKGDDSDFRIQESIKYWRSKFLVIPSFLSRLRYQKAEIESAMKESRKARYDLFSTDEPPKEKLSAAHDGMVKFLDVINKVRRGTTSGYNKGKDSSPSSSYASTPNFSSILSPDSSSSSISSTPTGRERNMKQLKFHPHSKSTEENDDSSDTLNESVEGQPTSIMSIDDCAIKVFEKMVAKNSDFVYIQHRGRLPPNSFISFDAVNWSMRKQFGLLDTSSAVAVFEKLRSCKQICHASGDADVPFAYGYQVFFITENNECKNYNFEYHWFELGFESENDGPHSKEDRIVPSKPKSALTQLIESDLDTSPRRQPHNIKTMLIPLNNKEKTGRSEWCQIQYPAFIHPWHGSVALTFNVQWMVATATCLYEMLHGWMREANRCNLYLLPSPNDPFAFPDSERDASPLHCPLFVPLNMENLAIKIVQFKDLMSDIMGCRERIILFMEKIAIRFGFIRYYPLNNGSNARNADIKNCRRFVHYTGQAFLEIPVTNDFRVQGRTVTNRDQLHLQHSAKKGAEQKAGKSHINLNDCGFYLSVNRMLTKRWRTSYSDDCPVDKLNDDFILFCSNADDRLADLYRRMYT